MPHPFTHPWFIRGLRPGPHTGTTGQARASFHSEPKSLGSGPDAALPHRIPEGPRLFMGRFISFFNVNMTPPAYGQPQWPPWFGLTTTQHHQPADSPSGLPGSVRSLLAPPLRAPARTNLGPAPDSNKPGLPRQQVSLPVVEKSQVGDHRTGPRRSSTTSTPRRSCKHNHRDRGGNFYKPLELPRGHHIKGR